MTRLGQASRITCSIDSPTLYHAVGQGALAIEIRSGDARVRETLRGVGHWQTEWRCAAERGCLRVLEGGCSVPVGVESKLEELDESTELSLDVEDFEPLQPDSPTLWFSGIFNPSLPIPESSTSLPPLLTRRARLTLSTCVTSLDGTTQVVHSPPAIVVGSYQQAERWGETCAREVRDTGGKDILDEIGRVRRERERRDLERAIEKSRAELARTASHSHPVRPSMMRQEVHTREDGEGDGEEDDGGHLGLDGVVSSLTRTTLAPKSPPGEGLGAT